MRNILVLTVLILVGSYSSAKSLGVDQNLTGLWSYTEIEGDKKTTSHLQMIKIESPISHKGRESNYFLIQSSDPSKGILGCNLMTNKKGDLFFVFRRTGKVDDKTLIGRHYFSVKEQKKDLLVLGGTASAKGKELSLEKVDGPEAGRLERLEEGL